MEFPLRVHNGRDLKHFRGFTEELLEVGTQLQKVSLREYKDMPPEGRESYNETRRKVITRGVMVRNDSYLNVSTVLFGVMREHQYGSGGGHGVLVSAEPFMGKTTVARILMLELLRQRLRNNPGCMRDGEVPVAYVNLPSTGTPVGLYRMLAQFYGLPIGKRETEATLEGMVQNAINKCRTEILVIDDVHNLKYGGLYSAKVSAAIRRLGDDISCPILLLGIGLERTSLVIGQEGAQIVARYRSANMVTYENGHMRAWRKLVKGLVYAMPLLGDNRQGITALSKELHTLAKGRIGNLNSIVSRAALDLIEAGVPEQEVITSHLAAAKAAEVVKEDVFKSTVRRGRSHAA
jgi:hypothetical protein